ncbi:MAG: GNAT family N-acetyltransferase [Sphingomonadaceae bacterium]|nr:GNAT family N-acetyltransferase [Sphingomonadaceae bacterium]
MTPVRWRRATPGDARSLAHLGAATFLESFAHDHPRAGMLDHLDEAHSRDFYAAALADPANAAIIGETPLGVPVGYALCTPNALAVDDPSPGDWEIKRIYLLAGWQGGGHGAALLGEVGALARALGKRRLVLAVYTNNAGARRFYERHGFSAIGTTVFMVGDAAFEDLIYIRAL